MQNIIIISKDPGSIWKWRYGIKHINNDNYLYAIINYIQKNSEKHLKIPYENWKYRSDIQINQDYQGLFDDLEKYTLEI